MYDVCPTCHEFLLLDDDDTNKGRRGEQQQQEQQQQQPSESTTRVPNNNNGSQQQQQHRKEDVCCSVCLGFWSDKDNTKNNHDASFANRLKEAVEQAVQPYHDFSSTTTTTASATTTPKLRFSRRKNPPRMNLPGDLIARFVKATAANKSTRASTTGAGAAGAFAQALKQHASTVLGDCLNRLERKSNNNNSNSNSNEEEECYPPCVQEEEQGYLAVYVVVLPASHVARPSAALQRPTNNKKSRKRRQQQQHQQQHDKGNNEGLVQQGGDPCINLETKLLQGAQGGNKSIWTMNQALNSYSSSNRDDDDDNDYFSKPVLRVAAAMENGGHALDIYVAVWRRPFYLQSMYTKTRRDVSQTPFYVVDTVTISSTDNRDDDVKEKDHSSGQSTMTAPQQSKRRKTERIRKKLGVTSVEEQILPTITKYSGGISMLNNNVDNAINCNNNTVQFGMAKFHASGREDMDVRMLLPPTPTPTSNSASSKEKDDTKANITGRPLVCEMIDAYRLPPMSSLPLIVNEINHTTTSDAAAAAVPDDKSKDDNDDNDNVQIRSYGNNPMGVGIAPCLKFVPSSSFKNLQAMTESKVKYYGCLCWSEKPLSSFKNGSSTSNEQDKKDGTCIIDQVMGSFPKQIHQRTPLRVLHRRPNITRQRHVLTCRATPIDDHYFRLHLSTDAGTYVKEFVHGDLGRTVPSVASLLGCKADILELDCEGIESHALD